MWRIGASGFFEAIPELTVSRIRKRVLRGSRHNKQGQRTSHSLAVKSKCIPLSDCMNDSKEANINFVPYAQHACDLYTRSDRDFKCLSVSQKRRQHLVHFVTRHQERLTINASPSLRPSLSLRGHLQCMQREQRAQTKKNFIVLGCGIIKSSSPEFHPYLQKTVVLLNARIEMLRMYTDHQGLRPWSPLWR